MRQRLAHSHAWNWDLGATARHRPLHTPCASPAASQPLQAVVRHKSLSPDEKESAVEVCKMQAAWLKQCIVYALWCTSPFMLLLHIVTVYFTGLAQYSTIVSICQAAFALAAWLLARIALDGKLAAINAKYS